MAPTGQGETRTTIREVAGAAGVSPATVSRVLNGRFAGDPAVAERVRETARVLRYTPNLVARSLATGTSDTIAFVVPDLGNPAFHAILAALSRAAGEHGCRVLVADTAEDVDAEAGIVVDSRRRADSVVLCAPRMPDDVLAAVLDDVAPAVLVNRESPRPGVPAVWVDYAAGIHQQLAHLYGMGHRRVAVLTAQTSWSGRNRTSAVAAFRRRHADLEVTALHGGTSSDTGYAVTGEVVACGATAVLAFNDLVALGLVQGLFEEGLSVPDDVSVVGFDDIPTARYSAPPLTTSSVPMGDVGRAAWEGLRALIEGGQPVPAQPFPTTLRVRGSTAPPRVTGRSRPDGVD